MRTEQLIAALASDGRTPRVALDRALVAALLAAAAVVAVGFAVWLGARPDAYTAAQTPRFLFKFVVTLALLAVSVGLLRRLARPGSRTGWWTWAMTVPTLLLAAGVSAELTQVPAEQWAARMIGSNARLCLTYIPLLSLPTLAALLLVLRHGAVSRPALGGAAAGLAAVGLAATLYALHCPDDSPLFVALWYGLAAVPVAVIGALCGPVVLKW